MSKMLKDSLIQALALVTGVATVFTILGFSMKDAVTLEGIKPYALTVIIRLFVLIIAFALVCAIVFFVKRKKYKYSIGLCISQNDVTVEYGNIFTKDGWRVIAMDTTFSTQVDDTIISKSSLHGKFVLKHGDADGIKEAVKKEASRRGLKAKNGVYHFALGTAIHYEGIDGHYIMVALTELNEDYEAHTKLSQYESTLMDMWKELNRVYAGNNLILPILGSGITRFDDGQNDSAGLLRCMLCTLNTSRVHFDSQINVVIYDGGDKKHKIPLYEYRDLCKIAE